MLRLHILRFNPAQPEVAAALCRPTSSSDAAGMTLFIALGEIREKLDPSLQFDFVCRAGICGSCAMLINGRPGLACRTLTKNLGADITLAPLPVFKLIGDLSVDTGSWMRAHERAARNVGPPAGGGGRSAPASRRAWSPSSPRRSTSSTAASSAAAASPAAAPRGCARTSSAPSASTRSRASGSTRATRADDEDFYELVGDDDGVFGCMSLLGCHDVCPEAAAALDPDRIPSPQDGRDGLEVKAAGRRSRGSRRGPHRLRFLTKETSMNTSNLSPPGGGADRRSRLSRSALPALARRRRRSSSSSAMWSPRHAERQGGRILRKRAGELTKGKVKVEVYANSHALQGQGRDGGAAARRGADAGAVARQVRAARRQGVRGVRPALHLRQLRASCTR